MSAFCIDNGDGVLREATIHEWGEWCGDMSGGRRVAESFGDGWRISTVCLGLNHGFGGEPLWYETMLFLSDGGERDNECRRYATREEAQAGHDEMVASMDPA
jgi:hypothetical protein